MSYKVVVAFDAVKRTYAKGTVQTFEEWPDDEKELLAAHYENLGWIEPVVVEAAEVKPAEPETAPQPEAPHAE
jgi:hypothetical protein